MRELEHERRNRREIGHAYETSDELTMHGMHNGLKPAMCSELVVDVVEMVAERLQADPQCPGNFHRVLTVCKQAQYALLLFGECRDRSQVPYPVAIGYCNNLFGELKHFVQQVFITFPFCDIAGQMHHEAWVSSAIFKDQG